MLANVKSFIQDANYNGKTLIGNMAGSNGTFGRVAIARTKAERLTASRRSAAPRSTGRSTSPATQLSGAASTVAALITATGDVHQPSRTQSATTSTRSATRSTTSTTRRPTTTTRSTALNSGLGSLVDADLAKESAQLTALQIRQQLGTQALSLANQAPQSLLSLFK